MDKLVNISNGLMLLTAFCAAAILPLNSCDDAGVNPYAIPAGRITITHHKLKPLDESINGSYWLWLSIDTSTGRFWKKVGSFNVGLDGSLNPSTFELGFDSIYSGTIQSAFVSVGFDSDQDINPHLVAGNISQYSSDSAAGTLVINDVNAVGHAVDSLFSSGSIGTFAHYILWQPTGINNCKSGLWFCDQYGNFQLRWVGTLDTSSRWIYEGWVIDTTVSPRRYFSTGQFLDPDSSDLDRAGACSGNPSGGFNKPGQDWVLSGEPCPGPITIDDGKYWVYITLEPRNESAQARNVPFYITLLNQRQDSPWPCGNLEKLYLTGIIGSQQAPLSVHIHISK